VSAEADGQDAPARLVTAAAGIVPAAGGAVCYGVATVLGRHLADAGVPSAAALGYRFSIAALCLAALLKLRRAPLRPRPGEWLRIIALGAIGYTLESTLFYFSLQRGTAAACILLFYVYPAVVTVIDLIRGREPAHALTFAALGLSIGGTALLVAYGHEVSITTAGIVLALGSAVIYAIYLLVGREMGRRTDPMTAACWVAVGAAFSCLARGAATGTLTMASGQHLAILCYGVVTAAAFGLTFLALTRVGASRTAIIGTLEAVSAVILAAAFLGEDVSGTQVAGGAAVVAAAVIIAAVHRNEVRRGDEPAATV
jgi:drug/metabolite transporter (DMT)-like permease